MPFRESVCRGNPETRKPGNPETRKPGNPETRAHLTGVVHRIIEHVDGVWAEIIIDGADNLYREIRIPHPLQNEDGSITTLKVGDRIRLIVQRST
jgi:hypothetical protein